MELALADGQTGLLIKEIGIKMFDMEMVFLPLEMACNTKESGSMMSSMEKVS